MKCQHCGKKNPKRRYRIFTDADDGTRLYFCGSQKHVNEWRIKPSSGYPFRKHVAREQIAQGRIGEGWPSCNWSRARLELITE